MPSINIVLNLILRMEKKIISILKNARFSGKGRQSLHIMRIRKTIIVVPNYYNVM